VPGTNWWVSAGGFMGASGGTTVGGGGSTDVITPRNPLDAARMADGFAPGASYPDGYLGTITDRHQDKMFGALQTRLTERSYQRGVHVGEKLGAGQYSWTADCNPEAGLVRQSMVEPVVQEGAIVLMTPRYAPSGNPVEKLTAMGKTATLPVEQQMQVARQYGVDPAVNPLPMTMTDPGRAARMRNLLPTYAR
jgi:hypothetical protein